MRIRILSSLSVAVLAVTCLAGQSARTAQIRDKDEAALKVAMDKEVIDGDLKGAIEQYKKIAQSKDPSVAARALLRMAECYRVMGKTAESRKIYEQVVRDYGDQKEQVALARARLGGDTPAMNSKLVWSDRKVSLATAVSPDGRYVVYRDRCPQPCLIRSGTEDLFIHEFGSGTDQRLTNTAKRLQNGRLVQWPGGSVISKDGKRIVYFWCDLTNNNDTCDGDLQLANLPDSGAPRRLYHNPEITQFTPWDWSHDGKSIAVDLRRKDVAQLGLISVPDGALRVLETLDWQRAGAMFFSPDDRWLGVDLPESATNPEHDVFVFAVDGSRKIHFVDHRGQDEMVGWSPDGKWLLFSSDRTGSTDLWAAPFVSGGTPGPPQLLKTGFEGSISLGVTRSGSLYYTQRTGGESRRSMTTASLDDGTGILSSPVELPTYRDSIGDPAWSPNGKRLAYISKRGPRGAETYVLVIRGESGQFTEWKLNLTSSAVDSWTPDGRSILIIGWDRGSPGFYLVNAETGDLKTLGFKESDQVRYAVAWAPDGRSFLIETSGSNPGVYRIDAGNGTASRIMSLPADSAANLYPKFSADGNNLFYRLAFRSPGASPAGPVWAIIERNISTGKERELIRRPFFVGPPKPTPDGQYIVTDSVDPQSNSRLILLLPIAGGEPRELMRTPSGVSSAVLSNYNVGQWLLPEPSLPTAPNGRPLLVLKRLSDSVASIVSGKEPSEFWSVPLNGEEPKKIGNTPAGFNSMALSPDGRHFAYTLADTPSQPAYELWVLENFLPKSTSGR